LRFPSTKARFCTEYLKIRPFIDWLLKQEHSYLIIQGIRADESKSRSTMLKECTYFKYYFEPYGTDKKGKPKYMTYQKKSVKKWLEKHEADILRPFLTKTASDVMNYIRDNGLKPNPLYYMGFKRVGCFPCIMCNKSEMQLIIQHQPKYLDRIRKAEIELQSTFFPPNYLPDYAKRNFKTKNGLLKLCGIQAVVDYLKGRNGTMFQEEESTKSCMSVYNICE
jgi:3'-phosphoadenosine 5'-phosphosulfate sulfotransferase (PAPS reductase)/FAD synthetase